MLSGVAKGNPTIVARIWVFRPSPDGSYKWLVSESTSQVFDSTEILASVLWRRIADDEIRVMPPFRFVLADLYGE